MSAKKVNQNKSSPVSDCPFHQPETANNICLSHPPSACSLECTSCCSKVCGNQEPVEPRKTSRLLPPKPEASRCEKCGLQPPNAHVSIQTHDQCLSQRPANPYRSSRERSLVIKCERELTPQIPIKTSICPMKHQCSDLQHLDRPSFKDLTISDPSCHRTASENLPPQQPPRCPGSCSPVQKKPSCSNIPRQSFDNSAVLKCEQEPTCKAPIRTSVCPVRHQCSGLHLDRPPVKDLTTCEPSCHRKLSQPLEDLPPPPPPPPKLPCPSTPGCLKPGCPVNCGPAQKKPSCSDISRQILDKSEYSRHDSMPPGDSDFPQRRGSDLNKNYLSSGNMNKFPSDFPPRRGSDLNKNDLSSMNIRSGNEPLNSAKTKRKSSKTSIKSNISVCHCPKTELVKEESGCTCHYPPAFKQQFQCAGAITGVCYCSKNK